MVYYKRARSNDGTSRSQRQSRARHVVDTTRSCVPCHDNARSFVKGIHLHDIDIKKAAARGLTSVTRLFTALYVIFEEAQCTKVDVEKLEAAEAKDAEQRPG